MTSILQRIVFHTGSKKEQSISLHSALLTPCLNTCASNGSLIAKRGCDSIPGWWMESQPRFAIRLPLLAQVFRHGVSKAECNEIDCSFLLPVWKTIRCKMDVIVWIKELKIGRFQGAAVS